MFSLFTRDFHFRNNFQHISWTQKKGLSASVPVSHYALWITPIKEETAKGSVKAKEGQGHKVELEWEEDGKTLSMCFLASVENFLASFDSFIASVEKS